MATVMVTDGLGRQVLVKEPRHKRIDTDPGRHGRGGVTPCAVPPPVDLIPPDAPMSHFMGKLKRDEPSVGSIKCWNKKIQRQLKHESERLATAGAALSRAQSAPSLAGTQRSQTQRSFNGTQRSQKTDRLPPADSLPGLLSDMQGQMSISQAEEREQRRKRERLARYRQQREADTLASQERVEQMKKLRDARFEQTLREVCSENPLKHDVFQTLRDHDKDMYRRAAQMCDNWHANVFDPVQQQILHHKNPKNRTLAAQQKGQKNVGFSLPEEPTNPQVAPQGQFVATIRRTADPMKKELRKFAEEEHFRREADRALEGDPTADVASMSAPPQIAKFTSRPVLEPKWWDELRLQSTRYGHFSQVCEGNASEGGNFRTMVKRGDHVPDAYDGIEPAGTRRGRHHKFDIGVLRGDIRHRGETFENKSLWGASSGAPNQDHFTYETGFKVTDEEFVRGKKMWHDLPGMPHRSIIEHFDETRQPVYRPRGGYLDPAGQEAEPMGGY